MSTSAVHTTRPLNWYWRALQSWLFRFFVAIGAVLEEKSFLEHLEELRDRIIKCLVALGACFAVCYYFSVELFEFVAKPITSIAGANLVVIDVTEAFTVYLKISFVAALYLSAPLILWQIWRFIAPGLYEHERRYARPFMISTTLFFVIGGVFGYAVAFPAALQFLLDQAKQGHMIIQIAASNYFSLFSTVMIVFGIVFEIPPVVFILSRIGLVTGPFLLRNTRWAIMISAIIAAVVTPTTDPFNMMVVAVPMVLLYLIGVVVAYVFGRERRAAL